MATKFDDPELDLARERVRSFERKSEMMRSHGGTISVDKNGEPSLVDERGGRTPIGREKDFGRMARTSLAGGPPVNGTVNLAPPGDDSHITGRVGGLDRRGPAKTVWGETSGPYKKQEAMVRPTKLVLPAVRPRRIANENGATSFHFSHEAISKTHHERTTSRGTKNRRGAAKDHIAYIERDGALAKAYEDDLSKIEQELQDIAKINPDLAERLGIEVAAPEPGQDVGSIYLKIDGKIVKATDDDIEEILEDPDIDPDLAEKLRMRLTPSARNDNEPVEEKPGVGALAGIYIEREEALAHDDNGTACLFTNISEDPRERREFWQEVEKRESDPSDDRMRIMLRGNREFWDAVAKDEACPAVLRQSIEAADEDEEVVVRTGDNEAVRKLMAQYGWKPREKRPENETDEQKAAREDREAETSHGARFEDGRGGRVQFRIVGELPYDVDHDARVRILKGFSEEFEKRGLPYISVMHAPDHTNDDRNWHFHLVYHDRPVKRFTGDEGDHLWKLDDDAPKQVADRHAVAKAALAAGMKEHIGKWDFAVPYEYQTACRHKKIAFPFTQQKNREVTRRPFIPSLRKKLAELTNRELEAAQKDRRLDPRRYSEMGIHKAPDVHLGTQAARLESVGVPTQAGLTNEQNQWAFIQDNLANKRARTEIEIERRLKSWRNGMAAGDLTDQQREKAEKEMIRWEQDARRASEHRAIALNLQEHYDRLRSRAVKLERMAKKHITAIEEGRATKRQSANYTRYEEKRKEAEIHLHGLSLVMAEEIGQIASSEISAGKYEARSDASAKIIDDIVSGGRALRKEKESDGSTQKDATKSSARGGVSNDNGTGLTRKEIDNYIARLVEKHRRLIVRNGIIVPARPTAKDAAVIASEGYERTQLRLGKLKGKQDEMISELSEAISRNPRMVVAKGGDKAQVADAPHSDRFNLATRNKRHQQAFRMFADEPEIVKAIDDSIARREAEARDRKTGRGARTDDPRNEATAQTVRQTDPAPVTQSAPPTGAGTDPGERAHAALVRKTIELTREKHLRPSITKTGGRLELAYSRQDVALHRVPERLVIEDERSISRIEGIVAKNDRGVRRLVAYLDKNPSAVREPTDSDPSALSSRAPAELRRLSVDHARDPQFKRAIENAVIAARLEASDPRRQPAPPQTAKDEVGNTPSTPTSGPAGTQTSVTDRTRADVLRKPADEQAVTPRPTDDSRFSREARDPDRNRERTGKADKVSASDIVSGTTDRPASKTNEESRNPESTPATEETPRRQGTLRFGPGGRLIRDAAPESTVDYGARTVSGEDAAAKAPDKGPDREHAEGRKKRRAVIDDRQMDLLGERTYERVPTRKLEKGISPKLDAWIDAEEKRDAEARRKAAAIIRGDRHLVSIVDEMDPRVRARLQRDWDGIDDRNGRTGRDSRNRGQDV